MLASSGGSRPPMGIPGGVVALLLTMGGIIGTLGACAPLGVGGPSDSATATAQAQAFQTQAVATARAQVNTSATTVAFNATATVQAQATATAQALANIGATETATTSCPTPSAVAQAIGDDASHISSPFEKCGFKLLEGIQREVHCPTGYGEVSFQYTPASGPPVTIRKCNGTETTSFRISGAVVRFVKWEPDGDACTVWRKSPGTFLAPGTTCP